VDEEHVDDCAAEDGEEDAKCAKKKSSKKKKAKAQQKVRAAAKAKAKLKATMPAVVEEGGAGRYQAGDYAVRRKVYIMLKKIRGVGHQAASEAWDASDEKESLLSGMSMGEKKRRRFVKTDKGK
jgi:hypothetical protein